MRSRIRCRTERVAALEEFARTSPYWDKKDDASLQLRHDLMRAKISGFMERPDTVLRRYPMSNDSLPARYARAIAGYKHGDLRNAVAQIDTLLQAQPNNPYFHELRGQALLEGGRPNEAIAPLRRAVQLSNNSPLIAMMLGQALVGANNPALADEAINILRTALSREPEAPIGYTNLAMAYGRKGNYAEADLASAQAAFLRGDMKTARDLASRAKTRFAVGSPGWVKADDIVNTRTLGKTVVWPGLKPFRLLSKRTFTQGPQNALAPFPRCCRCSRPLFIVPQAASAQSFYGRPALRNPEDHQGVPARQSGGARRGLRRVEQAAAGG